MEKIQGVYTALITPFKPDGSVDYEGLKKNIRYQIEKGINGILVLGTTGESPTLTRQEKDEIIRVAVIEAEGEVPVMVGTGSNSTQHTIDDTLQAACLGADIALIVTPYYNKPPQEGIYRHFKAVVEATDSTDSTETRDGPIPIMVYNIPGRAGVNIQTMTLERIADLGDRVVGVKEASGNMDQIGGVVDAIAAKYPYFSVMSGDDKLTLPIMEKLGGDGVISVVSNLVPEEVVAMVGAALQGDFETARRIHEQLLPLFEGAFIETNPIPIKAAMNMAGMPAGGYRLPLCEMSPDNEAKLRKILEKMKLV